MQGAKQYERGVVLCGGCSGCRYAERAPAAFASRIGAVIGDCLPDGLFARCGSTPCGFREAACGPRVTGCGLVTVWFGYRIRFGCSNRV